MIPRRPETLVGRADRNLSIETFVASCRRAAIPASLELATQTDRAFRFGMGTPLKLAGAQHSLSPATATVRAVMAEQYSREGACHSPIAANRLTSGLENRRFEAHIRLNGDNCAMQLRRRVQTH